MNLILNIGLARKGQPNLLPAEALHALSSAFYLHNQGLVLDSDTEPTLVIEVVFPETKDSMSRAVKALASKLGQDCIAVWMPEWNRGELIGPRPWGEFDGQYFVMPDGTRLVEETVTA